MTKIFMNSENTSPHSLVVNVTDKMDLIREDAHVALPSLSIYYTWKNIKVTQKQYIQIIRTNMDWRIRVVWWVVFCINYSKLLEAYHQKAGDSDRQSINKNMPIRQQNWELYYIQDWDLILFWTFHP